MTDRDELESAALGGNEEATFELACGLHLGRWGEPTTEKAAHWYRALAEKGHAESQYQLAWLLQQDLAPAKRNESWVDWYRRAAEQGHAGAAYNLGHVLLRGDDVNQEVDAGLHWLKRAWEGGDAEAATISRSNMAPTSSYPRIPHLRFATRWLPRRPITIARSSPPR